MAGIKKNSGHAVTSVLPAHSDGVQVSPANIQFQGAPAHQSGGAKKKVSGFPPAK